MALGFYAIRFNFEVEPFEVVQAVEFFFRLGIAAGSIGKHGAILKSGHVLIIYTFFELFQLLYTLV